MALEPAPDGWTRFRMKSKVGAGRDFAVVDPETDEQHFFVDGHVAARPKADVKDAQGNTVYSIRGSLLGIPKHLTITAADGTEVARLKAKLLSPIKSHMTLETSGEPWTLEGEFIEKNYTISSDGQPIVAITQKWVTVRDSYTLDLAPGVDAGLALAVLWAVDRWVERD